MSVGIEVPWRTNAPDYSGSERDSETSGDSGFDLAGIKEWEPGDEAGAPSYRENRLACGSTRWFLEQRARPPPPPPPPPLTGLRVGGKLEVGRLRWCSSHEEGVERLADGLRVAGTRLAPTTCSATSIWSGTQDSSAPHASSGGGGVSSSKDFRIPRRGFRGGRFRRSRRSVGSGPVARAAPSEPARCLVFIISDWQNYSAADKDALEAAAEKLRRDSSPSSAIAVSANCPTAPASVISRTLARVVFPAFTSVTRPAVSGARSFDAQRQELRKTLVDFGGSMQEFWTDQDVDGLNETISASSTRSQTKENDNESDS